MIKKYLLALPCLLLAGTAQSQTIGGCNTYHTGPAVYVSTSIPNLTKERDCFAAVETQAKISKESRQFQIDRLSVTTVPNPAIDPKDYIVDVGVTPGDSAGDPVGAFRVILQPTDYGYNDAVLYPGIKNGSPHGHSNYGRFGIDENTTTEKLLTTWSGGYNRLLGSAYWAPWLQRLKDGKIIQFDYISVYYKNRPSSDPECQRMALKGCVPLLPGIHMIAGYDMKRMGQAQPENQSVFYHMCMTNGAHRKTLVEAIADCRGAGDFISGISFPVCSDGRTDSPNHRDHVTYMSYGSVGYPHCPDTHPYAMPGITQSVKYTLKADDGPVAFSSDVTPGMPAMIPGTSFHADYIYGLHEIVATGIQRCIDKHLSCSDGSLGDTTQLKKPLTFTYTANPRIVDPPKR